MQRSSLFLRRVSSRTSPTCVQFSNLPGLEAARVPILISSDRLVQRTIKTKITPNSRLPQSRVSLGVPKHPKLANIHATFAEPDDQELSLHDVSHGILRHEGGAFVSAAPAGTRELPRAISRRLRHAGDISGARAILHASRAASSENVADLVELLLVLIAERKPHVRGPRENVGRLLKVVERSPATRNRTVCNILLSACGRESARIGDNSGMRREFLVGTALGIWRDMTGAFIRLDGSVLHSPILAPRPDHITLSLMYRICGDCRMIDVARKIFQLTSSVSKIREHELNETRWYLPLKEDTAAAYLVCLGKCRRSTEAENLYYSDDFGLFRTKDSVLSALFQAHIASDRISRAEALVVQRGANFLNVQSCNAFLNRCSVLQMREKAVAFVDRMRNNNAFPKPDHQTYNILIKALCSRSGVEDASVGALRGMKALDDMMQSGLKPSTVTYNTLIRNLASQGRMSEALDLYRTMDAPDHLTFSHLMLGAAKTSDLELAMSLQNDLDAATGVYPNYSFCKNLLEVIARTNGVGAAFNAAKDMVCRYAKALRVFSDVGGREALRLALISACGTVGDLHNAFAALRLDLGDDDEVAGKLAPLYLATELMQVCLNCNAQGQALEVFHSIKRAGLSPNFEVYEKLIHGLVASDKDYGHLDASSDDFDQRLDDENNLVLSETNSSETAPDSFDIAMALLCEMHVTGAARTARHAAYVYNTMIAAAGRRGDLDMASQIFIKMCRHNNPGVIYISSHEKEEAWRYRDNAVRFDIFEHSHKFPSATPGSYNSIIHAAHVCGRPELSFALFEAMQSDRVNEPALATYNLITSIALEHPQRIGTVKVQQLLKVLDGLSVVTAELRGKRSALRKIILGIRWGHRNTV